MESCTDFRSDSHSGRTPRTASIVCWAFVDSFAIASANGSEPPPPLACGLRASLSESWASLTERVASASRSCAVTTSSEPSTPFDRASAALCARSPLSLRTSASRSSASCTRRTARSRSVAVWKSPAARSACASRSDSEASFSDSAAPRSSKFRSRSFLRASSRARPTSRWASRSSFTARVSWPWACLTCLAVSAAELPPPVAALPMDLNASPTPNRPSFTVAAAAPRADRPATAAPPATPATVSSADPRAATTGVRALSAPSATALPMVSMLMARPMRVRVPTSDATARSASRAAVIREISRATRPATAATILSTPASFAKPALEIACTAVAPASKLTLKPRAARAASPMNVAAVPTLRIIEFTATFANANPATIPRMPERAPAMKPCPKRWPCSRPARVASTDRRPRSTPSATPRP